MIQGFKIRKANETDIPLIRELSLLTWPQTYTGILSKDQIEYMLELMYSEESLKKQMVEQGCHFLIIYDQNNPVGFASFGEADPGVWKLHKIYILPDQQGKGTGKFAIEHILSEIKSRNGVILQLQVNRYNNAKSFYEKLGFTVKEIADFDIGNGYFMNDYVMEKKI